MKPHHKLTRILTGLFCLLAVASGPASGQESDRHAPAYIEANQVELREKDNTSLYTGAVKITKGSIRITGEQITIKNKAGRLELIQIQGVPATFRQLNDLGEEIRAQSQQMEYRADNGLLELKQDALLEKKQNQFKSSHIIYDTQNDIVKAGQPVSADTDTPIEQKPPRVQITIQADKKKSKPE